MLPVKTEGKQWLWLLLWTAIGAGLRFANLEGKPPWTDEFRTIVLSVGNSFDAVPLDRVINIGDLLAPLIPNPQAMMADIVHQIAIEDRQPPIYFAIAYWWMKLFPTQAGFADLWAARALPAALGTLTIPCGYFCTYAIFSRSSVLATTQTNALRGQSIANFTAAMLAVSPYGVFIAQEARHYSLAILWITISISCLAIACQDLTSDRKLPVGTISIWLVVNILGVGTHALFGIALIAQSISLGGVWRWQMRQKISLGSDTALVPHPRPKFRWQRLLVAVLSPAVGLAAWLWWLVTNVNLHRPSWIDSEPHRAIELFNPLFQTLGAAISMLSLLLVEVTELPPAILSEQAIDLNIPTVLLSAILMLAFFAWVLPMLDRGIDRQLQHAQTQMGTLAILSVSALSILLYLTIPLLTGFDITRGARYHFSYFPGLMMLVGLGLASCWHSRPSIAKWVSGQQAVAIVLMMGAVSSAIVASNYGYHKYYRPELLIPLLSQSAPHPVLVVTTRHSIVPVGEMMGLGWEMRRTGADWLSPHTQLLLASQKSKFCGRDCPATRLLRETVDRFTQPIDLWTVNFHAPIDLPPTCTRSKQFTRGVYGYQYQLYHCQPLQDTTL
ncbi:hypothetical protein [Chamaesiphon sp. VAR_69_metabat_338]|uniref:glycosyltransferase family 39 protein n=1 Tax=Chamaesiphon sp. VAR_69_metabat_338 TaxID=2964704 RepID=UPI00286E25F2|nr:hypothetical protein [Chamaesiphon sp. VAR_69_metabat_338]